MSKRNFEATEGLLNDVMRKQAGSIEKALLEAVMNSVDAGASSIEIIIDENVITISDDGEGMTEEDIDTYFQKFGLKDDDIQDKEFGKFRMGRGQIFNFGLNVWETNNNVLVINLNEEETSVEVEGEWYDLDTEGLSYNVLDKNESVDGCSIMVDLYDKLDDVGSVVNEFTKLTRYIPWLHDVELTVNNNEIYHEFDHDFETDVAYYKIGQDGWNHSTTIYNKGAFVKTDTLTKTKSTVVSKVDLDVNFARNDILQHDDNWNLIKEEITHLTRDKLAEVKDLNENERKWLINEAAGDDRFMMDIKNKPLIPDVEGSLWSIDQVLNEKISFASKDNKLAIKAMEDGSVVMLNKSFSDPVHSLVDESSIIEFDSVVDENLKWEMKEYNDDDISKKRLKNLNKFRWFLDEVGFYGDVKAGFSSEENVWKDDKGTLFLDKEFLNGRKNTLLTEGVIRVLEVAANRGSTRDGIKHDLHFKGEFWKLSKNAGEAQRKLIEGSADYQNY